MRISYIIWPWGALRRAHRRIELLQDELADARQRAAAVAAKCAAVEQDLKESRLRFRLAEGAVNRLKRQQDEAHFRNPATGRLGRKGQTFQ